MSRHMSSLWVTCGSPGCTVKTPWRETLSSDNWYCSDCAVRWALSGESVREPHPLVWAEGELLTAAALNAEFKAIWDRLRE